MAPFSGIFNFLSQVRKASIVFPTGHVLPLQSENKDSVLLSKKIKKFPRPSRSTGRQDQGGQ